MFGHCEGDQTENADRSVDHDIVGHLDHCIANQLEKVDNRFGLFAHSGQAEAKEHRKEDHLKH